MKYEIRFTVKNHDGSIKMWSRRGCAAQSAEDYDVFIADYVEIEVRYVGALVETYKRGRKSRV